MTEVQDSAYFYFPYENKSEILESMHTKRYTFNCIKKGNYIYALAGREFGNDQNAIMSKCERFNSYTKKWEAIASLNEKRCSSMASIIENKIYIVGGYSGNDRRLSSFECYDEVNNMWEIMGIYLEEPVEASVLINV